MKNKNNKNILTITMPILYSNKNTNNNMKTIQQMTQDEAISFIKIKNIDPMTGYTQLQAQEMVTLIRTFIDERQQNCAYCASSGGLYEAKTKFIKYYIDNETNIKFISEGISPFCTSTNEETLVIDIKEGFNNPVEPVIKGYVIESSDNIPTDIPKDVTIYTVEEPIKPKRKRNKK